MGRRTKSKSSVSLVFEVDMEPVMEFLATGGAIADTIAKRGANARYMDTITTIALEQADDVFNTETAAYAMSTGQFGHMYEWGTAGINKGRSNVRQPASAPTARLWHSFSEGQGIDRALFMVYKPSVANVPKPTKAATGMDTDVIASMKDHVFTWKAKMIDEGAWVTIEPVESEFLLIPAYEHNRQYMRNHDIKRGYMLTRGPVEFQLGMNYESFAEWWLNYWMGQGEEILEASIRKQILSDTEPELKRGRMGGKHPRPVGTFSVLNEVAEKQKAVEKRMEARARLREARELRDND